jgi:hypothetical protein
LGWFTQLNCGRLETNITGWEYDNQNAIIPTIHGAFFHDLSTADNKIYRIATRSGRNQEHRMTPFSTSSSRYNKPRDVELVRVAHLETRYFGEVIDTLGFCGYKYTTPLEQHGEGT